MEIVFACCCLLLYADKPKCLEMSSLKQWLKSFNIWKFRNLRCCTVTAIHLWIETCFELDPPQSMSICSQIDSNPFSFWLDMSQKKTGWFTGLTERQQMLNTWLEQGREKMKVGKWHFSSESFPTASYPNLLEIPWKFTHGSNLSGCRRPIGWLASPMPKASSQACVRRQGVGRQGCHGVKFEDWELLPRVFSTSQAWAFYILHGGPR